MAVLYQEKIELPLGATAPDALYSEILPVKARDFFSIGHISADLKSKLQKIGVQPSIIRKAAIAAFEAEANIVIHACEGEIILHVSPTSLEIIAKDKGPGIANIEEALSEGFSTAPPEAQKMGFGSGLGLPNIMKFSDLARIDTTLGEGTCVKMHWSLST
jgi:anti-sigma regulatory factor (Ser/Thr protein kinase)